jgi:hypothetical protein
MPLRTDKPPSLSPSPVSVHDDGDMQRDAIRVEE